METQSLTTHFLQRFEPRRELIGIDGKGGPGPRARAAATAAQFEALFLKQMVSGMRDSARVPGGDSMFGSGPSSDTFANWFDDHLATHIAGTGDVGVAQALMREFERWHQIPPEHENEGGSR